jgi:uncharacterized protein (TIGR02271 family)
MALLKVKDFDPNYLDTFGGDDIKGSGVYTQGTAEKIGTIDDILVDEDTGEFRYLIIDLSVGTIGKKVLLPVGRSRTNPNDNRVYASISTEQAVNLPELEVETTVDYDYEERVRGVYRPSTIASSVTPIAPLETSAPLDASTTPAPSYSASTSGLSSESTNRDTYSYQNEPDLYGMNATDHQTLKLYEERLIANKRRVKTGEVAVGKHVETETARVSVPIEKERVVIERVTPADAGKPVSPGAVDFSEGEVAHVDIYEETPDIHKEAFVREEVRVTKVVEQETVQAQETIRHEELDVNTGGLPVVDGPDTGTRK